MVKFEENRETIDIRVKENEAKENGENAER